MGACHQGLGIRVLAFVVCACSGRSTTVGPSPAPAARVPPHVGNEPSGDEGSPPSRDSKEPTLVASGHPGSASSGATPPTEVGCRSDVYPAGETCAECLARCCGAPECQDNAACRGYRICVGECKRGLPCEQGCSADCPTGSQPVCYFMDCHHWMCAHACGEPILENSRKK